MDKREVDVLVIGSEGAGARAAIEAADAGASVTVVTKGRMARSGATLTGAADLDVDSASLYKLLGRGDPRDSPELFFRDMVVEGKYLNDQPLVEAHVQDVPRLAEELLQWGLKIYDLRQNPGHSYPRNLYTSGHDLMMVLKRQVKRRPIEVVEDTLITDLLVSDGQIAGAMALNLRSGEVSACEALLRFRHPERGMISPAEFIPVAEDTGLITELGDWVLRTACHEAASWPDHIHLAVNVSPVQLKCQTLALRIAGALAASGLNPSRLELEITEAVLIRDDEAALAILHQLRAIGVRIALDDFGTGFSSLSYLKRFPFDKIKIDRCFVSDISEADGSSSIVQAVVNIAAALHMTTVAEGVETSGQRELLRKLGCTEMQGYLFSAPKPGAEVKHLFRSAACDATAVA